MSNIEGGLSLKLKEIDSFSSLSPAAIELINKLGKIDTDIQDVVQLVNLDRVLYTSVLKYSQSAALSLRRTPTDVQEAISYLGYYGLRDLIYIINSKNLFFNIESWYRNVFTAFCAKKLSYRLRLSEKEASDNYIVGLLFDLGSNVFLARFAKEYKKIHNTEDLNERYQQEISRFGAASSDVSYDLLSNYKLPSSILASIKTQSLDYNHADYAITNCIINLSYKLSFYEFIDERDLEDILDADIYQRYTFNELSLDALSFRKLHSDVKEFISF
jgi:HD-like signal output (HDOD) protein